MKIRRPDELTSLEKLALIPISYSRLSTYINCRAQYFYSYITKEPRTFSGAATLGNIVHDVLEQHAADENLDFDLMWHSFLQAREKRDPSYEVEEKFIEIGEVILQEYVDRHQGERPQILAVEKGFEFVVGSALVNGFIDRIDKDANGRIVICDYKSGSFEVAAKDIAENLQLGIYALAVSQMFPNEEEIGAELYYLRSGRRKGHVFTKADLEVVEQRLVEVVNELIEDYNFTFTDDARICQRLCDFGKNGTCRVGANRVKGARY